MARQQAEKAETTEEEVPADESAEVADGAPDGGKNGKNGEVADGLEAIQRATELVSELTRRDAEGVVSMEETDAGGWRVGVEVVESRRIPDSADILAVYEAELDEYLELVGFRRVRRYPRGRGEQ